MGTAAALRQLPSVDALLRHPDIAALAGPLPRSLVVGLVRAEVERTRAEVRAGRPSAGTAGALIAGILAGAQRLGQLSLRRVINATGVVLHTNLGRAPLSPEAGAAMAAAAAGYSNLEYDLNTGERGSRHSHLESLIAGVTGAPAALAVNNNAAALLLVLSQLAAGREVIISRGQLVEIGGGFRIPDVLRQSGARLVEVGTTNRTRLADYAAAVTADTAVLLHVHTSNFRLVGFTEDVAPAALAGLARERGLIAVTDQGSGCLLDTTRFGVPDDLREPTVQDGVAAGVDLICFSGDKLLGGPQAGVIAGRADLITALKRHPLTRALRLDKVAIAGLAATLLHYRLGEAERAVPVWQMIGAPADELRARSAAWAAHLRRAGVRADVVPEESAIGGGSLPGVTLPTTCVGVWPRSGLSVNTAAAQLRRSEPAIVGRIAEERLLFDPRTVSAQDEAPLLDALARL
jgi:L-seryl-tRNA(Ser) seleniumtransferase